MTRPSEQFDLIVLSHLRWNFVFQRPQHLMTRFARQRRVFFFEEPIFDATEPENATEPWLEMERSPCGVLRAVPRIPANHPGETDAHLRKLLDGMIAEHKIGTFVLWYYTPMMLPFTEHLRPAAIAYDCMDELSLFKNAPASLLPYEDQLFRRADVVFTGGHSLYEHKKHLHPNIHAVPSSIDFEHFAQARSNDITEPQDQRPLPRPRLGYFGVIDERMDLELLDQIAAQRPQWQLVMLGPVVKIDPASLPSRSNIHYLGGKSYDELPAFIAGWDVAMLPFALNDSTRFISPTKTPEYLAAGKPVVSTPIADVVRPYGEQGLVSIARTAEEFIAAAEREMADDARSAERRERVDRLLAQSSWDATWKRMDGLLSRALHNRSRLGAESSTVSSARAA